MEKLSSSVVKAMDMKPDHLVWRLDSAMCQLCHLGQSLHLSVPQFLHLENGDNNSPYLVG